jgi:hypothetical protein
MDFPAARTAADFAPEALSDEELNALSARIKRLLAERKCERRKQALSQIRQIAKESGLTVSVKEPRRKPGRPRKDVDQT